MVIEHGDNMGKGRKNNPPVMVITLIEAKKNSASPYAP